MDENVKNNQLNDDELEKVSGGEMMSIDEIRNMIANLPRDPATLEAEAKRAEEEAREMKAKGYVQRNCVKCGALFWGKPITTSVMYEQYYESCCPMCRRTR